MHIVIIIHLDVDGVCTTRILQTCLNNESIQYSLVPVEGISDLKNVFDENKSNVKCFVLINCGGTIDLIDELEPEDDIIFFVLDSHRPTDVCNVYSTSQVRLLWTEEDDFNVPQFDEIFNEENDEEESEGDDQLSDSDNESEGRATKKRRLGEEEILKRRDQRLWEDNRRKILFDYTQYSYYTKASAIVIFDLACQLVKENRELLWYAIVAVTDQLIFNKVELSTYIMMYNNLSLEVERLSRKLGHNDVKNTMKIKAEEDLRLYLYRHWSVAESLMYSLCSCIALKLWTRKGERRLLELLADMSLPLTQSKQKFFSMDLVYRTEFIENLNKFSEKYNLTKFFHQTFTLEYGYRNKFSAADIVYSVVSLIEMAPPNKTREAIFNDALDCLTRSKSDLLQTGIERMRKLFENSFKLMKMAIDQKKVFSAGPFLYFIMHESYPHWYMYCFPHVLLILAQYIQQGYCEKSNMKNSRTLPIIVSCPKNIEEGTCLLVGLPPLCEESPKNFFGKAFEQAADRSNASVSYDYFDTSYIQLRNTDRTKFLDSLAVLLS